MKKTFVSAFGVGLVALATAAVAGVAAAGVAAADEQVAPAAAYAAPVAVAQPVAELPAIDAGDAALTYVQKGAVVTVTRKAAPVATVKLASAAYSAKGAKIVLSVDAARPFVVDPAAFTLYDAQGWENEAEQTAPVRFRAGTGTLTLTFTGTPARPEALGWVPDLDEAAVAVWERG